MKSGTRSKSLDRLSHNRSWVPVFLGLLFSSAGCDAEQLALTNGTVINPADGRVLQNALVVIEGDTITTSGNNILPPNGAKLIDCNGKFILPGYIDTHVH
ncbi:MAG: hypothetical protein ACJ8KU_03715, partial [Chthoniobacterales bacterium]